MMKATDIIKGNKDIKDDKELSLQQYKSQKINEMRLEKAYGGYEAKMEDGRLVHFKYWVNKKI